MIISGRTGPPRLKTASRMPSESRRVPGITMPPRPMKRSDTTFNQVIPRPVEKYLGLGRVWIERTGTVKRIPSADATCPPPQSPVIPMPDCAPTSSPEAARSPGRWK